MEENLLGYLLDALDPEEHRQVERYLHGHAEAQRELCLLRRALQPLAADRDGIEPPAELAVRTLERVAEQRVHDLPRAPEPVIRTASLSRGRWWRRADVLVAASLLFCVSLLVPPGIVYVRSRHDQVACANNLRVLGEALDAYARAHDNHLPNVADPTSDAEAVPVPQVSKRAAAGMFVPMLVQSGVLNPAQVSITCPANGPARPPAGWSVEQLNQMPDCTFRAIAARLAPCYAYTLGYVEDSQIRVPFVGDGPVPVLSDRPPANVAGLDAGNSPNHGGRGQNVLFVDGNVMFLRGRIFQGDDIYTDRAHQVHAGTCREDFVLGSSSSRP